MTESQRSQLIVDHLPQVRAVAAKIHRSLPASVDFDDVYQAGALGLIKAADRYDGRVLFWTFAGQRVSGEILDSLRRRDHLPREVRRAAKAIRSEDPRYLAPLSLSAESCDGQAFDVADSRKQPDEIVLGLERARIVRAAAGRLRSCERKVIDGKYFQEMSLRKLAAVLGRHETRLSQIHTDALAHLAARFAAAGLTAALM